MFEDDNWTNVPTEEAERLLKDVSPVDGKYATATTQLHKRPLPFYDEVLLSA